MARLRHEGGFTVVAAMLVLLVGLLFATAAVGRAISTESSVRRDGSSKRAVQAARGGMERTAYRLAALSSPLMRARGAGVCPATTNGEPEITATTSVQVGALAPVGGRCPVPFVDEIGAGELARTYVSVDREGRAMVDRRDVVAIGSVVGDVPRRVKTDLKITDISQILSDYTVFSDEDLVLDNQADVGTSSEVRNNAGSNGDIYLNQPNATIWGNATPGPGGHLYPVPLKGTVEGDTTPATEPLDLPDVDPDSAGVRSPNNDNVNICGASCPPSPALPDLSLSGGSQTIKGNTFLVCTLQLRGTGNPVYTFEATNPNAPIRIFIAAPSECGGQRVSVDVASGPAVVVTKTTYKSLQVFVVGDPDNPTTVNLANNYSGGLPMTLYAPNSSVVADNRGAILGGIVAGKVTLSNNTVVNQPSTGAEPLWLGEPPRIERGQFLECAPRPDVAPNLTDGC